MPLTPFPHPLGNPLQGASPPNPAFPYPGHFAHYGGATQTEQPGDDDIIIATIPPTVSSFIFYFRISIFL